MDDDAGSYDSSHVPIRIHNQGDVPLYLQIKYQLSYLITTERIPGGARLPAVRSLAADLGINPHTVAQAYRELQADGLIESFTGRGSFVRAFGGGDQTESARHARLTSILREARHRARALGFANEEIAQRLSSLVVQEAVPCSVAFADRAGHIAEKYARRLEHHLGPHVGAVPLTLQQIEGREAAADRALADVYYVLAFARYVPPLERALAAYGGPFRVLTIVSEVTPETRSKLASLPSRTSAVMLTEERYIYNSLDLVSTYSTLDTRAIPVFTETDGSAFVDAASKADLVLYTFGLDGPLRRTKLRTPTLEILFDVSADSVTRLREVFAAPSAAAGRAAVG